MCPGTILATENSAMNKTEKRSYPLHSQRQVEETNTKEMNNLKNYYNGEERARNKQKGGEIENV